MPLIAIPTHKAPATIFLTSSSSYASANWSFNIRGTCGEQTSYSILKSCSSMRIQANCTSSANGHKCVPVRSTRIASPKSTCNSSGHASIFALPLKSSPSVAQRQVICNMSADAGVSGSCAMLVRPFLASVLLTYLNRNPTALRCLELIEEAEGGALKQDHFAFRTFGV